jgi:hypothetical protein
MRIGEMKNRVNKKEDAILYKSGGAFLKYLIGEVVFLPAKP